MSKQSEVKVRRFSKGFVVAHGVNAISFLALYITALPMYAHSFSWLFPVFGGPANARLLHRIFACIFVTPTIIYLIMDPKGLALWMKELITWKKRDLEFFSNFVKDLFGFRFKHIRQTFYNAGEKVNSMLQILCALMIICSGITIWFSQYFPRAVVQWGYLFHDIGFGLAIAVVVGHVYLSVIHKNSRPGYTGVITGEVPAWWAREHHTDWYDEEAAKGNFPKIDQKKKKEKGA